MIYDVLYLLLLIGIGFYIYFKSYYFWKTIKENNEKEKIRKKEEQHLAQLDKGLFLFEWQGISSWEKFTNRKLQLDNNFQKYLTYILWENGSGYFKDEKDLEVWLKAQDIEMKWSRKC